jgi:zinc/manganese transport system substrate-binding protein
MAFMAKSKHLLQLQFFALGALGLMVLLGGWGGTNTTVVAQEDELQVVTTFLPITEFTQAVAGDRAEVEQLLPTNVGPHDYQPDPDDALILSDADVLVQNGLGMEEFLEDLVENAANTELVVVDSSSGIATISNSEEHAGEEHADEAPGEDAHEHGAFNPHIWLDPKRAMQQVETIRDALIAADPAGRETYTANAAAYLAKLQTLDTEMTQTLQPYKGKTFVTYHDFAPYFAQSYGLKAEFLVDVPEENPSPGDVKRVIDAAQASELKTLLTEPQAADNPFDALAADLNVQVSNFDPLETSGADGLQANHYLTIMRQNLQSLEAAFAGKAPQAMQHRPIPTLAAANKSTSYQP